MDKPKFNIKALFKNKKMLLIVAGVGVGLLVLFLATRSSSSGSLAYAPSPVDGVAAGGSGSTPDLSGFATTEQMQDMMEDLTDALGAQNDAALAREQQLADKMASNDQALADQLTGSNTTILDRLSSMSNSFNDRLASQQDMFDTRTASLSDQFQSSLSAMLGSMHQYEPEPSPYVPAQPGINYGQSEPVGTSRYDSNFGNGGADYNNSSQAVKNAMVADYKLLQTSQAFRDSETARANQVIANRQAAGMDVSLQQKYLGTINKAATSQPTVSGTVVSSTKPAAAPAAQPVVSGKVVAVEKAQTAGSKVSAIVAKAVGKR